MNRACSTRSAEPATSSALSQKLGRPLSRLPIRVRLALSVATVVFVILAVLAVAVGAVTAHRLRSDFNSQVNSQAVNIANLLHPEIGLGGGIAGCSAALHLARRGYSVALLEARSIGYGASYNACTTALLSFSPHAMIVRTLSGMARARASSATS